MLGGWLRRAAVVSGLAGFVFAVLVALPAQAQTAESNTYQATDLEFGTTTGEGCSEAYCAQTTLGEVVIGDSANDVMNAQFYDGPDDEPSLEVIIANSSSNMGVLKTDKIASKTMALRVKATRTTGYSVQIEGDPPKYGQHVLRTTASPSQLKAGQEGFGINAVANTTPKIGRNPTLTDAVQDQTASILEKYRQPDKFTYRSGDTVIKNSLGTGRVDYVVSMAVTISSDTPPGYYAGTLQAIVAPLF